jgi:hypothetical protein
MLFLFAVRFLIGRELHVWRPQHELEPRATGREGTSGRVRSAPAASVP